MKYDYQLFVKRINLTYSNVEIPCIKILVNSFIGLYFIQFDLSELTENERRNFTKANVNFLPDLSYVFFPCINVSKTPLIVTFNVDLKLPDQDAIKKMPGYSKFIEHFEKMKISQENADLIRLLIKSVSPDLFDQIWNEIVQLIEKDQIQSGKVRGIKNIFNMNQLSETYIDSFLQALFLSDYFRDSHKEIIISEIGLKSK